MLIKLPINTVKVSEISLYFVKRLNVRIFLLKELGLVLIISQASQRTLRTVLQKYLQ